ncbi:hypothetical protein RJ641_026973 [Dillenia turbinata]|uniref:Uncharacterized protein n=1 Tax=Dillenia turbinata TaxID=194707 RepID=A0AAN8ZKW8_9MAGN
MKALGVKKFPGCSFIGVDGNVHEFLVGETSHPEMTEISSMLNRLAKPLLGLKENELVTEDPVKMEGGDEVRSTITLHPVEMHNDK